MSSDQREYRRRQLEEWHNIGKTRLQTMLPGCEKDLASFEYLIKMAAISPDVRRELDRCIDTQKRLHEMSNGGDGYGN